MELIWKKNNVILLTIKVNFQKFSEEIIESCDYSAPLKHVQELNFHN